MAGEVPLLGKGKVASRAGAGALWAVSEALTYTHTYSHSLHFCTHLGTFHPLGQAAYLACVKWPFLTNTVISLSQSSTVSAAGPLSLPPTSASSAFCHIKGANPHLPNAAT